MSAPPVSTIPSLAELSLVIEGARVRMRVPRETDAEALFAFASDPALTTHMTWAAYTVVDQTRDWIRSCAADLAAGTDIVWIVQHQGAPVGCIGLHDITWASGAVRYDRAELGYWIAPSVAGQGLMTEAVSEVMQWAFEELGLHKVLVGCWEDNVASRRVIEKVGFRHLCRQEEDVWRDGRWHARLAYEITRSEWTDTTRTLRFKRPA